MNSLEELRLHVRALKVAVEKDEKFFTAILHYVRRLDELARGSREAVTQSELVVLAKKIDEFFDAYRPSGEGMYIPPVQTSNNDPTVLEIRRLVDQLAAMDEDVFAELLPVGVGSRVPLPHSPAAKSQCVFLGHGRSKLWARVKMYLEDELDLATVSYESESRVGESIVPILEKMLDQATFAVLVLTAEDDTQDGSRRARQNVIHEAGLLQGRLGFKRAVLLVQQGVEEFTNVAGLQHVPFSGDNIEQAFYELSRVLKREKVID